MPIFDPAHLASYAHAASAAPAGTTAPAKTLGTLWYVLPAAAQGADWATTEYALAHDPTREEANPLLRGKAGARGAIKGAVTLGEWLTLRKLAQTSPTAAKVLSAVFTAIPSAVAIHNLTGGRD